MRIDVGVVQITLGQRLVRVDLATPLRWVEDVNLPVTGGPPAVTR